MGAEVARLTRRDKGFFLDKERSPKVSLIPRAETTVLTGFRGERMMMVLGATPFGLSVPLHSHPQELVGMVYAGRGRLRIGEEERVVSQGDFLHIPPDIPHQETCLGTDPFVVLTIFCPVREDVLGKLKRRSTPGRHGPR